MSYSYKVSSASSEIETEVRSAYHSATWMLPYDKNDLGLCCPQLKTNLIVRFISVTLKYSNHNCSRRHTEIHFFLLFRENKSDISCELSARQMIPMKYQALFSLKNNSEKIRMSSAAILFDHLRVITVHFLFSLFLCSLSPSNILENQSTLGRC